MTALARLQELERHYYALFDQAAVGVAQIEAATGRIVDINRKSARIFAISADALLDRDFTELAEAPHQADMRSALQQAAVDPSCEQTLELPCRRGDGEVVWVRITASSLAAADTPTDLVVIIQDVSDRMRIQESFERQRDLLAESQRIAAIGSFRLDYETRVLSWTDEMYRLHGVSPDTFVPSRATILPLIHPDDRAVVGAGFPQPATPSDFQSTLAYRVILADGTIRALCARGTVVRDRTGTPVAAVGTVQDVTERERAASASRESEARERVAIEASRAKSEFLTHMSHELRTPLNAVLGLSEALLESTFGELNDAQTRTLATIHESGRHLLDLINDVLDIARVETGKLPIEQARVPLRPLIDETTALAYGQLMAKRQRLLIDVPPTLPALEIDRRRVKQVLLNLLGNASKFSPPATTIILRASERTERGLVEIAVSDDGPGIPAAERERIFEPFVTLDRSMSRSHDGAGLGLSLAKRIVELHGGRITVESEPGRGSTFTITLPVSAGYVTHPETRSKLHAPRAASLVTQGRILLAEDNEPTVLTLRSYLESHGYEVDVVRDGVAALEAAMNPAIAVVLMDIKLPGLDGLEAMRQIRARERAVEGKPRLIIALTAHAMPGHEERCLEAGASAYLSKPVRLRELVNTIQRLLEDAP